MTKQIDKTRYFRASDLGTKENLYLFYVDGSLIDKNVTPQSSLTDVRLYLNGVTANVSVKTEIKSVEKKTSKKSKR